MQYVVICGYHEQLAIGKMKTVLILCKWTLTAQDKILLYADAEGVLYQTTQTNVKILCSEKLLDGSKIHFSNDKDIYVENTCDEFELN